MRHLVPVEPIRQIILRHIASREMGEVEHQRTPALAILGLGKDSPEGDMKIKSGVFYNAYEALSFDCGVSERTLRRLAGCWVSESEPTVFTDFNTADKIVTHTEGPQAWLSEPLSLYYLPLDVEDYVGNWNMAKKAYGLMPPFATCLGWRERTGTPFRAEQARINKKKVDKSFRARRRARTTTP